MGDFDGDNRPDVGWSLPSGGSFQFFYSKNANSAWVELRRTPQPAAAVGHFGALTGLVALSGTASTSSSPTTGNSTAPWSLFHLR